MNSKKMSRKIINILTFIFIFFAFATPLFAQDFKIYSISVDESSKLFLINGNINSSDLELTGGRIDDPPRAYIDIQDAILTGEPKQSVAIENSEILGLKIAQFSTNPNVVRVVIYAKTQEAISKIKLIKSNNSIAFQLDNFTHTPPKITIKPPEEVFFTIYKDEFIPKASDEFDLIPRKVIVVKKLPAKKTYIQSAPSSEPQITAQKAKYNINSISQKNNQIVINGKGAIKLAKSFVLEEPYRIVFDLPNGAIENKELLKEFTLDSEDTVRIGQFDENTIRVVITSEKPEKYRAIISADLQSLIIGEDSKIDYSILPSSQISSDIKKIDIKVEDEKTTKIIIEFNKPVVHSVRQTLDRLILDLYNVKTPEQSVFAGLKSSNQFRGLEFDKMTCQQEGISIGLPVGKSLDIETGINEGGTKLYIKLSDNKTVIDTQYVVIGSNRKVVLDAGHGGKDVGAMSGEIYEKDINFIITNLVSKYLKASGVNVVKTRNTDKFISLKRRVQITNAQNPDIFVSIHVNSSEKPSILGVETHWFTRPSKKLAKIIHQNLSSNVATHDRGLFYSRFYVIHHSLMPSVLVEVGFISNEKEKHQMLTTQRQKDTARSISNGILLYLAKNRR